MNTIPGSGPGDGRRIHSSQPGSRTKGWNGLCGPRPSWSRRCGLPTTRTLVDASIRQFCATAKARLQACSDFDANRDFLVDQFERVIYDRYRVIIVGAIPVRTESAETKLPFRIKDKIDIAAIRSNSSRKAALATASVSDTSTWRTPFHHTGIHVKPLAQQCAYMSSLSTRDSRRTWSVGISRPPTAARVLNVRIWRKETYECGAAGRFLTQS
jgi:hypothetical protein